MSGARARPSLRAQLAVKSLLVYRNGDPFFAGRRVVVREKGCSFDALLREAMMSWRMRGDATTGDAGMSVRIWEPGGSSPGHLTALA
ncbi:Doublecortin Domain-Containing Protein 2, partial [Manis pentadactyla]